MKPTHEVFNQAEPLADVNLYRGNQAAAGCAGAGTTPTTTALASSRWAPRPGRLRCRCMRGWPTPTPRAAGSHDRFGRRIDQVEFHPATTR
jgi:putative acyl-CoA dehydrogenase